MSDTMTEHRAVQAAAEAHRAAGWKQVSLQGWGRSTTAPCLAARPELQVAKTLLWSDALGLNLEGLCLGPPGTLLGISDNDGRGNPTTLVGFAFGNAGAAADR
jgi:hypothetical protein